MAKDELMIVVMAIGKNSGELVSGPDLVSRGFVYVRESEKLLDDAKKLIQKVFDKCLEKKISDWGIYKVRIKDALSNFIFYKTRRSPMILPIIVEI